RLQKDSASRDVAALHPAGDADTAGLQKHLQRLPVIEARVADALVHHDRLGALGNAALDHDAGALALDQRVRAELAAAVGADGDDPRLDDEVIARVRIHLDPRPRAGPIGRRDVDGDGVVVERERADAGGPGLVTRLLLPAGPELLAIEERVVEHDLAHAAQAAVPEVGHQRVEPLGGDGRIAAAL